jgi:hypothetical protein
MERRLRKDKLLETAERLTQRISERFPQSGLSRLAAEVVQLIREAVARAETIRRPNLLLRVGLGVLAVVAVGGVARYILVTEGQVLVIDQLLHFLDQSKGVAAYLAAIAIFLITLEVRLKRRRALQAVHELRAVAHIIDMYQLSKDLDRVGRREAPLQVAGKVMNAEMMWRYLHYCTELLALISKVGQLYVEDFPDATAQAAVDQFDNLTTGLSGKIWQKIMVLDRIRADVSAASESNGPAAATAPSVGSAPPSADPPAQK